MRQFFEVIIIGAIINGSVYAMMSIGLSMIYGVTKIFNYAYGSLFTLGGYIAWVLIRQFDNPYVGYPFVFIAVLVSMFGIGLLIDKVLITPLRKKKVWDVTMLSLMITLGFAIFLENLIMVIFGTFRKSLPYFVVGTVNIEGIIIDYHEIAVLVIAFLIIIVLQIFLNKSKLGMAIRAVSQDKTGAQIVGIPVNKVYGFVFGLSTALVGISAILLGPKIILSPMGGWPILIKAFIITALGGLGSIKGALYAAFILAFVEAAVALYIGMTWIMIAWFIVLITILIVKPSGLFGVSD